MGVRFPYLARAGVEQEGGATRAGGGSHGSSMWRRSKAGEEGHGSGVACGGGWPRGAPIYRRGEAVEGRAPVVVAGEHHGAPLMALRPLVAVVEWCAHRGRHPGVERARGRSLWPTSSLARSLASRQHRAGFAVQIDGRRGVGRGRAQGCACDTRAGAQAGAGRTRVGWGAA